MKPAEAPTKKSAMTYLGPLVGLALFGLALWFLKRQLGRYSWADVAMELKRIPLLRLGLALTFTAVSHFVLTLYDYLGSLYVGASVPYRRAALASFVSYAISHNVGFSAVTGAPFRLRVYGKSGVHPLKTALIIGFCGLSFWLGFLTFGGSVFVTQAPFLAGLFGFSPAILRLAGVGFLMLVSAYLFLAWKNVSAVKIFKWRLSPPRFGLAAAQVACSVADWLSVGTVLFFLFPVDMPLTYFAFLGVFVLAQVSVFTSQVPGGIGVIESVFIGCLSPAVPATAVFGALIAYRAIYYLLPFGLSVAIIGVSEIAGRKKKGKRE